MYVEVNQKYVTSPSLEEKRKSILQELEGENERSRFARDLTVRVLHDQLATSWRFRVGNNFLAFVGRYVSKDEKRWDCSVSGRRSP